MVAEALPDCPDDLALEANARLIAAAPEMYELLKRIDDACLDYAVEAGMIIKKIEGKAQ